MNSDWYYDDFNQIGTDFTDIKEIESYDQNMSVRDFDYEANEILELLHIDKSSIVLDIGCGTGTHASIIAEKCNHIYAVDASKEMIIYASKKYTELSNLDFFHASFLALPPNLPKLDAIYTLIAWHHLPDVWKVESLVKMNSLLKDKGRVLIRDTIYDFDPIAFKTQIAKWLEYGNSLGNSIGDSFKTQVKEEYCTYAWLVEPMFKKTNFKIISKSNKQTLNTNRIVTIYTIQKTGKLNEYKSSK